jgi:hypothetical protein
MTARKDVRAIHSSQTSQDSAHLHALAQHVVGEAEGLLQRGALAGHLQQLVVGDLCVYV